MIDLICTLIVLAVGIFSWNNWHSAALTAALCVAAILITRNLKPFVERPWQRKHPPVKVDVLKDLNSETVGSMGVHFLIMTQEVFFNCRTQADTDYLLELCDECVEKLMEDETFKYRYNYVQAKKYPIQFAYCGCGNTNFSVSTHYMRWIKSFGLSNMNGYKEKLDMFTIDDSIKLPNDGTVHSIMFQALFDPKLPAPEGKKEAK